MLYCEIDGPENGKTIMLSNSLGTTLEMWDPQMDALTEHFRVIRFDHRGHGRSPVKGECSIADLGGDVLELLDGLEMPVVSFAGLSLGGMVGMWLAAHAPERIDRLALLCTSAKLGTPDSWSERANAVRTGGTASITEATTGRWFTPGFGGREPYVAMLAGISDEGYAACCEAIGAMDLRPDLPRIKVPTLVLAGADDPATPPDHAERIVSAIPGSRLVVLPGAAHLANVERPDEVSQHLIRHFLQE
jgi:3-oxoadipate enol-lactonase